MLLPELRIRLGAWSRQAARYPTTMAMPRTTAAIGLILLIGLGIVISQPRPRAVGLARVLATADLLQSFPIDRSQPVPELWLKRLGPQARPLWSRSSGSWWQLWSHHDDREPILVLNAANLPANLGGPTTVRLDDLVLAAPDPLAAQELAQGLQRTPRQHQGLQQRCLERLQREQAVYWSAQGLAGVLGPITPLLMRWQQGCLSLHLTGERLSWSGEASAVAGLLGAAPTPLPIDNGGRTPASLPSGTLLAMRGSRLELLLGSLLGRPLLRDSLTEHYGLDADSLKRLISSPFELRLRSLPEGPFRLGLTVVVPVGRAQGTWIQALDHLEEGIRRQGMVATLSAGQATNQNVLPPSSRSWTRADGTVVGGWRWLVSPPRSRSRQQPQPTLLLYVGPPPASGAGDKAAETGPWTQGGNPSQLQVLMRPSELASVALLPTSLPPLLQGAPWLELVAGSQGNGDRLDAISPLWGELRLAR